MFKRSIPNFIPDLPFIKLEVFKRFIHTILYTD